MDGYTLFALQAGPDQIYLTARTDGENGSKAETAEKIFAAADLTLNSCGMRILHERAFGTLDFYPTYSRIRKKYPNFVRSPFSYIEGKPVFGRGLSGIQIHAVKPASDADLRILYNKERPCGSLWERKDTTYLQIAGIHGIESGFHGNPQDGEQSRIEQASSMFENMKRILDSASIDFHSVVRTWFYLSDILEWYDLFNTVRTGKFRSFGLISGSMEKTNSDAAFFPASTGIGGRNPAAAICYGDALAISGKIQVSMLQGTLQPSAYRYGSAFSRGICVEEEKCRQIFVSGTAAIDAAGRSLHPGDADAQALKTLEVIEALIGEKGAKLNDIRSATVYLKKAEHLNICEKHVGKSGLMNLPVIFVVADICRDELLFEMDALAVLD